MSYKATNWAYDLPLTGTKKFVLVALADMADEENSCFPGQRRIADMVGRSVETVRRALIELETMGLIARERRIGSYGYRTSDRYWLSVGMTIPELLPVKIPTGQSAHKASRQSLPVIPSIPTGHDEGAIEPSVEPSEEPSGIYVQSVEDEFAGWYADYPRKQARVDALKAFKAARKDTSLKTLVDGVQVYKLLNIGADKSKIKLPAGWLRGRRWEDEDQVAHQIDDAPKSTDWALRVRTVARDCSEHPGYPAGVLGSPCVACARDGQTAVGF